MINKDKKNISGLTLIEIMIGVVISTIMMAAMYTSYNVVNSSYSKVTDKAKISRAGRDIITMMMRDIRLAGFKYYYGQNNLGISTRDNLDYWSGANDIEDTHAPIIIIKNKKGYDPLDWDDGEAPEDLPNSPTCCDRIHIVYGDFIQHDAQQYKRYRITYFADLNEDVEELREEDQYYSIYKTKESWRQDFGDPNQSRWTTDPLFCPECYVREEVRSHIVDMEFIANSEDGRRISPPPRPDTETPTASEELFNIKTVDLRLTFRSKNNFFRSLAALDRPRLVKGIGNRSGEFTDRYYRDSVVVTIYTRNIGEEF
tara:strand:- start:2640 stop:3581 length:942 start_codon:yes stop_codon:yes gene_type:complete